MFSSPNDKDDTAALASNARPVPQRSAVERIKGPEVVANHARQAEEPVFVIEVQARVAHVNIVGNQGWVRCYRADLPSRNRGNGAMDTRSQGADSGRAYVLGHSDREIERLKAQARLVDPITTRFFREAGVAEGMRVLDVGSGAGDVAFLVADLVGERGTVVGVDRAPAAIDVARRRAATRSRQDVIFHVGDPAELPFDRLFDAVVGRYVLQFQPDPAAMLRKLATRVRPGGVIVFHEIDWGGLGSFPPVPTFDRCSRLGADTLRLHGTESRMGAESFMQRSSPRDYLHQRRVLRHYWVAARTRVPSSACLPVSLKSYFPKWSACESPRLRRSTSRLW